MSLNFFSANFSVSAAFEAERKGSSEGLKGNNLYVEDDVAMAISYCEPCYAILGFSKFIEIESSNVNPYQFIKRQDNCLAFNFRKWKIVEPISLDLLKKRSTFRNLNATVLTNLQLFIDYLRIVRQQSDGIDDFNKEILDSLTLSTPSIEEVNNCDWLDGRKFPFLSLVFDLDMNYSNFFG